MSIEIKNNNLLAAGHTTSTFFRELQTRFSSMFSQETVNIFLGLKYYKFKIILIKSKEKKTTYDTCVLNLKSHECYGFLRFLKDDFKKT